MSGFRENIVRPQSSCRNFNASEYETSMIQSGRDRQTEGAFRDVLETFLNAWLHRNG